MKTFTAFLIVTFLTTGIYAQKSNYKVFPFKSGVIEYKIEGKTKGTNIKYIEDYGYKQADVTNTVTKFFGQKTIDNSTDILIGPKIYAIDHEKNTLTKARNPVYETYANESGNYEELGIQAMDALGFKDTGETGTVLGNKCTIWKGPLGEIWTWKGLALKTKTKLLGIKMEETAVKIDLDSKVSAGRFEIPSGLEEQKMPEGQEDIQGALNSLFGG